LLRSFSLVASAEHLRIGKELYAFSDLSSRDRRGIWPRGKSYSGRLWSRRRSVGNFGRWQRFHRRNKLRLRFKLPYRLRFIHGNGLHCRHRFEFFHRYRLIHGL
jgi:hypothetical protein